MGAITSDFPLLPNQIAGGNPIYTNVYNTLTNLGLPTPAEPANTISRADLLLHLQTQAGAIIANEINSDPTNRGYSGQTNADIANLLVSRGSKQSLLLRNAHPTGYRVTALSTQLGVSGVVTDPELGAPGFDTLIGSNPSLVPTVAARFKNNTPTVGLRRQFQLVFFAPTADTLNFAALFPETPVAGDRFDLLVPNPGLRDPRWGQVLRGLPYAPNRPTEADIAAALS